MADSESRGSGQRSDDRRDFARVETHSISAGNLGPGATSQQQISLDIPRPDAVRTRNEYVQVTKLPALARRQKKRHRNSVPASSRLAASTEIVRVRRDGSSPVDNGNECRSSSRIVSQDLDGNFQKLSIPAPVRSKNSVAIPVIDSPTCSTSYQRSAVHPGRAVRVVATPNARNGVDGSTFSAISVQPRSVCSKMGSVADYSMEKKKVLSTLSSSLLLDSSGSIICKTCGRCRCSECATPRELPSRLICGDHCELSSGSVVDAISCMCCVKACLYHTTGHVYDDFRADDYYENGAVCDCDSSWGSLAMAQGICGSHSLWSCSSKSPDRCYRWTILGAAMACLPCMWIYLPLRACAAGVEAAYGKYYDNGCHCDRESASIDGLIDGRSRNRRSHTLPPELPSIAAAKKAAVSSSCDLRPIGSKAPRRYSLVVGDKR